MAVLLHGSWAGAGGHQPLQMGGIRPSPAPAYPQCPPRFLSSLSCLAKHVLGGPLLLVWAGSSLGLRSAGPQPSRGPAAPAVSMPPTPLPVSGVPASPGAPPSWLDLSTPA